MLLYIHIPFCDSKCFYCAFNSYSTKANLKESYMKALNIQLQENIKKHLRIENKTIDTIFIGGGTPSTINPSLYKEIFNNLQEFYSKDIEITCEANPNSATKEWQKQMFDLGVNRISFGVQSFDNDKLKFLGRNHNTNNAIKAIQNAKCIGFNSINCDIIYGLQNDSFDSLKQDFDILSNLKVEHISAYSLIIEENTKFFIDEHELQKSNQSLKIDDEELSYKLFNYLQTLGYKQYEIANFSKDKKFESKHNFGYWSYKEYLGIGAGAVACIKNRREYSQIKIEEYINNPLNIDTEILSQLDIKREKVLLGLRSRVGIDLSILNKNEIARVKILQNENKICINNNTVYNINFSIADELALYILD